MPQLLKAGIVMYYFMRHLKFGILVAVLTFKFICFAQVDTLKKSLSNNSYRHHREKSSSILLGIHLQETKNKSGNDYKRKYVEAGLHKSILTDYAVFTHGLSVEVSPEKQTLVGLKYGGWANYTFVSLGLSGIYYTDFQYGSFIIRPEFGLGVNRFRIAVGYNISPFSSEQFSELKEIKGQFILNVFLRRKLIKRD